MLALLIALSSAYGAGYYDFSDVAAESTVYASASTSMSTPVQTIQSTAAATSDALHRYQVAIDLLGERVPRSEQERLDRLEKDYNRQFARVQAFADLIAVDFDEVFTSAINRAVKKVDSQAIRCPRQVSMGRAMRGLPQRMAPNPDCIGADLNKQIAAAMDADAALNAAVDEMAALSWPPLQLEIADTGTAAGAGDESIDVATFFVAPLRKHLKNIAMDDDMARLDIQAAMESGATTEELRALVNDARAIDAATAQKRSSLASPILAVTDKVLEKWAKKEDIHIAWCASPEAFGGCGLSDVSEALIPRLHQDKKVSKALNQ